MSAQRQPVICPVCLSADVIVGRQCGQWADIEEPNLMTWRQDRYWYCSECRVSLTGAQAGNLIDAALSSALSVSDHTCDSFDGVMYEDARKAFDGGQP